VVTGLLSINLVILAAVLLRPDPVVNPSETGSSGKIIDTKPAATTVIDSAAIPIRRSANDIEPVAGTPQQQTGTDLSAEADLIASVDAPSSPSADMHLDIHVYAGLPADRFVFINMSKYKERATLAEGPTIKEITPQGVILEYGGTDFLLPRE
jgi:hypothetical protein